MGKIGIITHKTVIFEKKWDFFDRFLWFCDFYVIQNHVKKPVFLTKKPDFWTKTSTSYLRVGYPKNTPFLGFFGNRQKSRLFRHWFWAIWKRSKKRGQKVGFLGGPKMAFLEKLKFYYVVEDVFFGFWPFFFVFFWPFLSIFDMTRSGHDFWSPFFDFFWTLFFLCVFYVFKFNGSFYRVFEKKGSKKWPKNGPKMAIFGSFWDPFWDPFFGVYPLIAVQGGQKVGPKMDQKMDQKLIKNGQNLVI